MSRKPRLDSEEKRLFREAVKDVRRLQHDLRPAPWRSPPAPRPRLRSGLDDEDHPVVDDLLSDNLNPWELATELESGDELFFARSGLQHQTIRRLRRGQYPVSAELDLHGLTQREARQELTAFLHYSLERGLKCVRVIHGKGNRSEGQQAVLKNRVNHWLRQSDDVLAFSSALPADGGSGAVYVLLRRRR